MGSVHKVERSPYWHAFYVLPDGRRTHRSTGTSSRRKAMAICLEYEKATRLAKEGRLTETRARQTISDIYAIGTQDDLEHATIKDVLDAWLARKRLEVAETSIVEYERASRDFLKFLGAKAKRPADALTIKDVSAWRTDLAVRVSGGTVNKALKIIQGAFIRAAKDRLIRENPFAGVDAIKGKRSERRAFTQQEVGAILKACDVEWRGIVLFGYYIGQRLGDIARLTWQNVDLEQEEVRLITRKTDHPMVIPIHPVLLRYLLSLPSSDDPTVPVFPNACPLDVATLSRRFVEILASIGLREPPGDHVSKGKGRDVRREVGAVSFHCLRHTATSALKNAGVSDVIAREIIGHDSEAISRVYTHIETKSLREAVNRLPDLEASENCDNRITKTV